jgi:replication initiation protein RepC
MTGVNAQEGPLKEPAGSPTGFRRLRRDLLNSDRVAESFVGMPVGTTRPGQLLAALKAAASRLNLPQRLIYAVDWLFKFTKPQDWQEGSRPIVWPSARLQQEELGLSETQIKTLNRNLIQAGLIAMKDSPNGKRYGTRDSAENIVEAYGFDLSPIAVRYAEFVRLGQEARQERKEMGLLRRRATIAENSITQILEAAKAYRFQGEEWATLRREVRDLRQALGKVKRPEELAHGVESLERRHVSARERLDGLVATAAPDDPQKINSDPQGPENRPHLYNYNPTSDSKKDTVIASEKSDEADEDSRASSPPTVRPAAPATVRGLGISPDELVRLTPKLGQWLSKPLAPQREPAYTWQEVVDAAAYVAAEHGVSPALWADACHSMGRGKAAIAIAVVSTKDPAHFKTTAAGYFRGMVNKHKIGQLNLDGTLWALRRSRQATDPGNSANKGGCPNRDPNRPEVARNEEVPGKGSDPGLQGISAADRVAAMTVKMRADRKATLAAQYRWAPAIIAKE